VKHENAQALCHENSHRKRRDHRADQQNRRHPQPPHRRSRHVGRNAGCTCMIANRASGELLIFSLQRCTSGYYHHPIGYRRRVRKLDDLAHPK
jgi:hypothetical protein